MKPIGIWTSVVFYLFFIQGAWALTPEEVLVIANSNAAKSRGLATYYMEQRKIPPQNLVMIWMTDKETCTRFEYEAKAIPPIRRFLKANPQIRALVTLFGVPLKIRGPDNSEEEIQQKNRLNNEKKAIEQQLNAATPLDPKKRQALQGSLTRVKSKISRFKISLDKNASFDSELSLVKQESYDLNSWQPNPFYLGFKNRPPQISKSNVMMTSRLDAASPKIVRRIIDDSIEAEREGLAGTAYFDARWKDPGEKKLSGYAFYDRSIHKAAQFHSKLLPVVVNDTQDLFQPGDCPNAALYCGWYSLAKYIDAFQWAKGSVGYHIASSEAATLKGETSQVWCKRMLDKGIAATIGPTGEPYVQAFPVPEIFFNFLTEGYLTLAESYMVSLPYLSWKMVLIGDPLYRMNLKDYKK
jgi:uncharacterized protein (TIGR03790 family)